MGKVENYTNEDTSVRHASDRGKELNCGGAGVPTGPLYSKSADHRAMFGDRMVQTDELGNASVQIRHGRAPDMIIVVPQHRDTGFLDPHTHLGVIIVCLSQSTKSQPLVSASLICELI